MEVVKKAVEILVVDMVEKVALVMAGSIDNPKTLIGG
jgi:hypothetical protein